jgi:hypothetical protein
MGELVGLWLEMVAKGREGKVVTRFGVSRKKIGGRRWLRFCLFNNKFVIFKSFYLMKKL